MSENSYYPPQNTEPQPQGQPYQQNAQTAQQPPVAQQPQYQQPDYQPYQQNPYQQPYQPSPYQQPYNGMPAKSAAIYIVLSVLEFLFCGGLFAIIPFVFAIQGNSAYKMGDIATGDAKCKNAKIALIVIAAIGILAYIALFVSGGALIALSK